MKNTGFILIVFITLNPFLLFAQKNLSGIITKAEQPGVPLEGVEIYYYNKYNEPVLAIESDLNGRFSFRHDKKPGEEIFIQFVKEKTNDNEKGYMFVEDTVTIKKNEDIFLRIEMQEDTGTGRGQTRISGRVWCCEKKGKTKDKKPIEGVSIYYFNKFNRKIPAKPTDKDGDFEINTTFETGDKVEIYFSKLPKYKTKAFFYTVDTRPQRKKIHLEKKKNFWGTFLGATTIAGLGGGLTTNVLSNNAYAKHKHKDNPNWENSLSNSRTYREVSVFSTTVGVLAFVGYLGVTFGDELFNKKNKRKVGILQVKKNRTGTQLGYIYQF